MGRRNKNARSRPQARRAHTNKYINKIGCTKAKHTKHCAANLTGRICLDQGGDISIHHQSLYHQSLYQQAMQPLPGRYEVWFADLGNHYGTSVQSGCRPVLVISNDVGNQYSRTVTVIPLTTRFKRMDMPTHITLTEEDCCMFRPQTLQDSVVLAEQITTIAKSALCSRVCRVTSREKKQEIVQAVAAQLDMQQIRCDCDEDASIGTDADTIYIDSTDIGALFDAHKEETVW